MRILIVEDDELIAETLSTALTEQHYVVDIANNGKVGWDFASSLSYSLILLDVILPELDGLSFCKQLRSQGDSTPILFMTAKDARTNLIRGLDAGADDYVTKPFDIEEILARVRALLRRGHAVLPPTLKWDDLELDPSTCVVSWRQQPLKLTPKEYSLLELLLRNPQRIYSSSALIDHLWALDTPPTEDTIRSHIKGLRHKLRKAGITADPIETVYGIGYRLRTPPGRLTLDTPSDTPSSKAPPLNSATFTSPPPVFSPSLEQESPELSSSLQQGMSEIWQQSQPQLKARLTLLEQAIAALRQGRLDAELAEQASQQAHKLVGTLGMFGADAGSAIAQQVERTFQGGWAGAWLDQPTAIDRLESQVQTLRQTIEQLTLTLSQPPLSQPPLSQPPLSQPQQPLSLVFEQSVELEDLVIPLPQHPETIAATVMVLDSDGNTLRALETLLQPWGFQVITCDRSEHLWAKLQEHSPQLLILDVDLPKSNGISLCQTLRNSQQWSSLPILFLTTRTDAETMHRGFAAGADDWVSKPFAGPELVTRILNRLERSRLLRSLAEIDPLTGVTNQRKVSEELTKFLALSERHGKPFCLALVEIAQLQDIHYYYGSAMGDQVLQRCGQLLKQTFRSEDLVGRWGNEEFVVGMYGTTVMGAMQRLLDAVQSLRNQVFVPDQSFPFDVTLNIGIAATPQDGQTLTSLYQTAQQSLHQNRLNPRIRRHQEAPVNF
ncbi:response regulator [Alkalinema pantanalense CENA528]|uniref:response regulator n=1 Tax=Alkalinema pantanalense TaxID=1620705 RepID=UPI003D6DADB8